MRPFFKGMVIGAAIGLCVLGTGTVFAAPAKPSTEKSQIAPKGCQMTVYQAYLAFAEHDYDVVEVPPGRKTVSVIYEVRHSGIKGAEQLDRDKPDRVDLALAKDGNTAIVIFSRQNCVIAAANFSKEHFVALMDKVEKDIQH